MIADAYATAFMVMGLEKSQKFLSSKDDLEGYFVYRNNNGKFESFVTENFKKRVIN